MRATPARPEDLLAHADFVRGLARSLLWGEEGVDDVVQDAWAAGIAAPPRDSRAARSWLGTVVRNLVRQRFRSETRRRAREEFASRGESVPSTQDVLAREEQRQRVVEAVLALHPPSREVVLLRYFEGLPPREIARRLGEPVETVRTRLKRALAELRARLDEGRGGDRRAWAVLLVPLASGGGRIGPGWAAGGAAMGAAAKIGVAAAVLLVAATLWAWPRGTPSIRPERTGPSPTVAGVEPPHVGPGSPIPPPPAGPTFAGRALDAESGLPLRAARVSALRAADGGVLGEARTSEDGSFSVHPVGSARATLRLAAEGYEPIERLGATAGTTLTLRARRLANLVLRLRDGRGDPIAGARTVLWSEGAPVASGVSDAEGFVRWGGLVPGDFLLGALPPTERRDLAETRETLRLSAGETKEVALVLGAAASSRGRVVDAETGNPIAGARIRTVRGMVAMEQVADAEGAFPFDHAPDGSRPTGALVLVTADGYETRSHQFSPSREPEFTVRLRRSVEFRFRAEDEHGRPIAGARFEALAANSLPMTPIAEGDAATDGTCVLAGFSQEDRDTFVVAARAPDGSRRASAAFVVGFPEGLRARAARDGAVVLRLLPSDRALALTVRRAGQPAEGARVRIGWIQDGRELHFVGRRGGPPPRRHLRSVLPVDSVFQADVPPDGTVRWEGLPRGTLAVEVDGHAARGWLVSTRDGDATLEIDLSEAVPETTVVRGIVRTADGPLPGAFVHILDSEGRMRDGSPAGKDGRFQITTQRGPPWGLRVSIAATDGSVRLVDFPAPAAGEEADLLVR